MFTEIVKWTLISYASISILSYYLPAIIQMLLPTQNFKTKYNAKWALVTGGSQGIGEGFVDRLASQGINVVIVALDDIYLQECIIRLELKYPYVQFRAIGIDLSNSNEILMARITKETGDIDISLLFNNAGYMKVGMFAGMPSKATIDNFNVNAGSILPITHYFVQKMIKENRKGLVCFTSSSGMYLPSPMGSMYAATKQFVTTFGASLAAELSMDNIDVCVVNPSPVASNFFDVASDMSIMASVKNIAQPPSVVADVVWKCAGRFVVVEQGYVSVTLKMLTKIVDWNVLADIFRLGIHFDPDFKKLRMRQQEELAKH